MWEHITEVVSLDGSRVAADYHVLRCGPPLGVLLIVQPDTTWHRPHFYALVLSTKKPQAWVIDSREQTDYGSLQAAKRACTDLLRNIAQGFQLALSTAEASK